MNINRNRNCICLLGLLLSQSSWSAEDFGRIFTTPNQRQQLDELRKTQTDIKIEVQDEELAIEQNPIVEAAASGELRLKGLVYRNDGKNTAWINDSNSYEGDLSSQYTGVNEDSVAADEVVIEMGGADSGKLSLKVGQSFNPVTMEIRDISSDQNTPGNSGRAVPSPNRQSRTPPPPPVTPAPVLPTDMQ